MRFVLNHSPSAWHDYVLVPHGPLLWCILVTAAIVGHDRAASAKVSRLIHLLITQILCFDVAHHFFEQRQLLTVDVTLFEIACLVNDSLALLLLRCRLIQIFIKLVLVVQRLAKS